MSPGDFYVVLGLVVVYFVLPPLAAWLAFKPEVPKDGA